MTELYTQHQIIVQMKAILYAKHAKSESRNWFPTELSYSQNRKIDLWSTGLSFLSCIRFLNNIDFHFWWISAIYLSFIQCDVKGSQSSLNTFELLDIRLHKSFRAAARSMMEVKCSIRYDILLGNWQNESTIFMY